MNKQRVAKFSVGSKVKLNVGGPDMAVLQVMTNGDRQFIGRYKCQWFAGKKLDEGLFAEESLVEVVENVRANES